MSDSQRRTRALDQGVALLGPLEGRIMRLVWMADVPPDFTVRDVHEKISELAYTTLMTTLVRLAEKGLLEVTRIPATKAHRYNARLSPKAFLARAGREGVDELIERFGDTALAAFAERLDGLSPEQRKRLRRLAEE
jgi:predicted transcriptional regulator